MTTYTINGVDLATLGVIVERDSLTQTIPAVRATNVQLPNTHGFLAPAEEFYEGGHLTLTIIMTATGDRSAHQANLDALFNLVRGPVTLTKTMPDGSTRQVAASMRAAVDATHRPGAWTKLVLPFDVPSVFWRDANLVTFQQTQPTSGTAYTISGLAGSTAPITDALVLWTGPVTNPAVACTYSGSKVQWNGTVSAGTQLRLDAANFTAVTGTGIGWSGAGSDASGSLAPSGPGSAYRMIQLVPEVVAGDATVRRIRVTPSGSSMSSATVVAVQTRKAFL